MPDTARNPASNLYASSSHRSSVLINEENAAVPRHLYLTLCNSVQDVDVIGKLQSQSDS